MLSLYQQHKIVLKQNCQNCKPGTGCMTTFLNQKDLILVYNTNISLISDKMTHGHIAKRLVRFTAIHNKCEITSEFPYVTSSVTLTTVILTNNFWFNMGHEHRSPG